MRGVKLLPLLLLFCLCSFSAMAQHNGNGGGKWKEVLEFKIKYLAQEMDLNSEQTARFAELYKNMSREKYRVFKEVKESERKLKGNGSASDADYEAYNRVVNSSKTKDAEIESRYEKEFDKFLTKKQIFLMKNAEDKFRERMGQMRGKKRK